MTTRRKWLIVMYGLFILAVIGLAINVNVFHQHDVDTQCELVYALGVTAVLFLLTILDWFASRSRHGGDK